MAHPEPSTLSFDCYGTLVDWERGIVDTLGATLRARGASFDDETLLGRFAHWEHRVEQAHPRWPYPRVLAVVARHVAGDLGTTISPEAAARFGQSVGDWPPFRTRPRRWRGWRPATGSSCCPTSTTPRSPARRARWASASTRC
jgi:hypothetical protein